MRKQAGIVVTQKDRRHYQGQASTAWSALSSSHHLALAKRTLEVTWCLYVVVLD